MTSRNMRSTFTGRFDREFLHLSRLTGEIVPGRHGQHISCHHRRHLYSALCQRRRGNHGRLRQELAVVRPALDRLRRHHDHRHSPPWLLASNGWINRPVYGMYRIGEDNGALDQPIRLPQTAADSSLLRPPPSDQALL